jgi:hypothetical protein
VKFSVSNAAQAPASASDALIGLVSAGEAGEPLPMGGHESRARVLAEASAELARRLGT